MTLWGYGYLYKRIISMKTSVKFAVAAALAVSPIFSFAQTVQGDVSVTVQNTIGVSQTTALSFGTIQAKASTGSAEVATMAVPSDNSARSISQGATGAAQINEIVAPNRGEFAITGAASQTTLTISFPASVTLTPEGNSNTATFSVSNFEATDGLGNDATASITTDVNGDATLYVGATLSTEGNAPSDYITPNGPVNFVGTYDITITY